MNATFVPRFRLGPYELLLHLASGGMASVILARQHGAAGFERLVVIKRVHRRHLDNADFRHMFRDEARLASSIRHSNVVSVIDVIENEGELSLVMEYFESLSLGSLVVSANERQVRLSPRAASRIVSDTLFGLHAAHEAVDMRRNKLGIVHRDMSPQNVIVDVGGVSRVIDFGIAKAETRITHTKSGFVKGKLGYMSPEQIEALPLDRRSDLFSTAIVLRELLTGKQLFSGDDEFETMRRVLQGDVADVSTEVDGIPPELDAVLRKALARSPEGRFQTALLFQEALERAVPPVPAHEVGSLVSELGKEVLDARHDQLLSLLGEDFDKLSPRSPPRAGAGSKGNTLPIRLRGPVLLSSATVSVVDPSAPTLRDMPQVQVRPAPVPLDPVPIATLNSAQDPLPEEAVSAAIPTSKGSLLTTVLVGVGALGVGLVVTFLAIRPDPVSSPVEAPSATAPQASPSLAPLDAAIPSVPDAAEPRPEPSPSRPSPIKVPVAASGANRPKPPVKPLLQPNPYDDSK
jgi:serine/threonine protein kinase